MSNNALPTTVQLKKAFDIAKERLRHPPVPESSAQEKRQWAKNLFAELDDANALLEPARPSDPDTVDKAEKSLAKARSQLNDYIEQLKTLDPESEDSELDRDAVEAALVIDNGHDHSSGTRCARRSSRIKSKAVIDSASGQNEEMVVQKTSPKPSVPLPKNISVVGSRRARGSSRIKSKEFIDSDSDREEGMTGQQPPKSSIPKPFSVQRQTTVNEEPSKEQLPRESSSSMMKTTDSAAVDVKKTRLHELSDEIQIGDQRSTIVCQYVTPMTPGVVGTRPVWRSSLTYLNLINDSDQDEDMVRHDALNPFILSPVQTAKLRSAYEGPREEELLGEPSEKGKMLDSVHGSIEKTLVELGDTIRTSDQRPTTVSPVVTPTPPRAVPSSGQNDWVVGQQPPESFVHSSAQTTKQLSASATCEVQRKEHVAGEPSKKRKTMDSAGGPATKTRFREPSDAVLRFDQWPRNPYYASRVPWPGDFGSLWSRPRSPSNLSRFGSGRYERTVGQRVSPKSSIPGRAAVQTAKNHLAVPEGPREEQSAGEPFKKRKTTQMDLALLRQDLHSLMTIPLHTLREELTLWEEEPFNGAATAKCFQVRGTS